MVISPHGEIVPFSETNVKCFHYLWPFYQVVKQPHTKEGGERLPLLHQRRNEGPFAFWALNYHLLAISILGSHRTIKPVSIWATTHIDSGLTPGKHFTPIEREVSIYFCGSESTLRTSSEESVATRQPTADSWQPPISSLYLTI